MLLFHPQRILLWHPEVRQPWPSGVRTRGPHFSRGGPSLFPHWSGVLHCVLWQVHPYIQNSRGLSRIGFISPLQPFTLSVWNCRLVKILHLCGVCFWPPIYINHVFVLTNCFLWQAHSRDVYHAKRMFKLNCVLWSADNKYILSGSSDHNVRIWKAQASEKMGIVSQILLNVWFYKQG